MEVGIEFMEHWNSGTIPKNKNPTAPRPRPVYLSIYLTLREVQLCQQNVPHGTMFHMEWPRVCSTAQDHLGSLHPPSEADIKVTRDLIRAGQLLKIEVLDHVILGRSIPERPQDYLSLRALGYFL